MHIAQKVNYCSACFRQDPEMEYVDLEAYWDGPVLDQDSGIKQPIDDLVLCENCLRNAAKLIGMVYDEAIKQENKELGMLIEDQENQIKTKDAAIRDLKSGFNNLEASKPGKRVAA